MILCSSSIGRVIGTVLQYLCVTYNWIVTNVVRYTWCYVTMPAIVDLLQFVKSLASLGGQGASQAVQSIIDAMGGGKTPTQCADSFSLATTCNFGCYGDSNSSANSFVPQAMATICWSVPL